MKTLKQTTIAILILTLLFSMAIPAMAIEPTYDITIDNDATGHQYAAYQIFDGDMSANVLVNIKWGDAVETKSAEFLQALKDAAIDGLDFSTCENAGQVAIALQGATATEANEFAIIANTFLDTSMAIYTNEGTYTMSVPEGYYFIKDEANFADEHDSNTLYILRVSKNVEIAPKSAIPTVVKKVEENTETDLSYEGDDNFNDVADWSIGETRHFRLYATIPENDDALAGYSTYKIVFHDEYSDGITVANIEDFTATYRVEGKEPQDITGNFVANREAETNQITYTCSDLITAMGQTDFLNNPTVVITYKATLNEDAAVGTTGNPNEVYLEFSNDAYGNGTGNTPVDKVIVFTYELSATKVDGDTGVALGGAKFKLMNGNTEDAQYAKVEDGKFVAWVEEESATVLESLANGTFTIKGLDADTYYLEETEAPAGYNKLTAPIELTITATYKENEIFTQTWDMSGASSAIDKVVLNDSEDDTVTIANFSGFTLPETGGLGTTLIYTIGGILVIGVSVILITRKRMSNQD